MRSLHAFATLPLLLTAVPAVVHAQGTGTGQLTPAQAQVYEYAVQAFHERRYPSAYARFARLADAGHVPSAEIALAMYRHGATLFASAWYASLDQQRGWNALVVNASRGRVPLEDLGGD